MALSIPNKKLIRPLNGAITQQMTAGAAGQLGQAVYIDSDGKAQPAFAGSSHLATQARARGVVVASTSQESDGTYDAEAVLTVVTHGPVAGFDDGTEGSEVYVSTATAGAVTQTKPSGAGQQVMAVGYMQGATVLYVAPQTTAPVSGA
jgi:hypothetical protein